MEKLKLMIVDDEKLVRELIRLCVDWEELGFEIVGMASSAEEGEELFEELKPDVVFTDVRMPEQTGLDLARSVLTRYPGVKVVVISGYDEFTYVNEGLKAGIFDYLLKPISEEALREVGCKVRDAILRERKHAREFAQYKKEFEQNYEAIRERAISRLVYSSDVDLALENLTVFDITLHEGLYQTAVVEYGSEKGIADELDLVDSVRAKDLVRDYLKPYPSVYLFERRYPHLVLIFNQPDTDFLRLCRGLAAHLAEELTDRVRIGIGGCYQDVRQLTVSYREAQTALRRGFTRESGTCILYDEIKEELLSGPDTAVKMLQDYRYYLLQGMIDEAKQVIRDDYDSMGRHNLSRDQVTLRSLDYVLETCSAADEMKISTQTITRKRVEQIEQILQMQQAGEMRVMLLNGVEEMFVLYRQEHQTQVSSVAKTVEDYVKENYADPDISLAKMAEMVYVNPNYLSRAFKKRTGKTFREYLHDLRMTNAMLLLQQTSLRAYEISERVGIKDPNYFSACFKKKFGFSVQEVERGEKSG